MDNQTNENRAKWLLRTFFRQYKVGIKFHTGTGFLDIVERVESDVIYIRTSRTMGLFQISRKQLQKACTFLFYVRNTTRKQLEGFSKFSSALMGLLFKISKEGGFARIGRTGRTARGLLRLSLRGMRWFTAGCRRSSRDMEMVKFYNGQWLLLSYFHLREDKTYNWRKHVWRLGYKGRVLLDSVAIHCINPRLKGKQVADISIEEYCDFIKRQGGKDMFCGWFSLDRVDDADVTERNIDYMVNEGLGDGLIPVWNINSRYS